MAKGIGQIVPFTEGPSRAMNIFDTEGAQEKSLY